MLSRQLRIDAFGKRVRVTEICPGRVATDIFAHVHGDSRRPAQRFVEGFELPQADGHRRRDRLRDRRADRGQHRPHGDHADAAGARRPVDRAAGSAARPERQPPATTEHGMKDFDLLAILLNPEFGAMLLHGLQMTLHDRRRLLAAGDERWPSCCSSVRLTPSRIAERAVAGYVSYHRNVPTLVQLMLWYFGISSLLPDALQGWLSDAQRRGGLRDHRARPVPGGLLQRGPALGPARDPGRARPRRRARSATATSARCATC